MIDQSVFKNNIGQQDVLYFSSSTVKINIGEFYNNVGYRLVVASLSSDMTIKGSRFDYNRGIVLTVIVQLTRVHLNITLDQLC